MTDRGFLRRATSILIAVSMVLTPFTGLLVFAGGIQGQILENSNTGADGEGDWYIGEDYTESSKTITGDWPLTGNLTIRSGGVVEINNGVLEFSQEYPFPDRAKNYTLIIEDGGKLILRNSTLRADLNNLFDFPSLGIIVRNNGVFEAYDSTIMASGHLVVDNSTFNMTRSVIKGNPQVSEFCDPNYFPKGIFDDSMVLLFMSSEVNLFDSRIENVFEPGEGDVPDDVFNHDYPFARDVNDDGNNRSSVSYTLLRMPSGKASADTTGQPLVNITADDLKMYEVAPSEVLHLSEFDVAGLMFQSSDEVHLRLNIKYNTTPDFLSDSKVNIQYGGLGQIETGMTFTATGGTPIDGEDDQVVATADLPEMSAQDLRNLNVIYSNSGTGSLFINKVWVSVELTLPTYGNITVAGNSNFTAVDTYIGVDLSDKPLEHNQLVLMDSSQAYLYGVHIDETQHPYSEHERKSPLVTIDREIEGTARPTFYIYRWANITVQDSEGHLVEGAYIHSRVQSTGQEAHYYTPNGVRNYPCDEVLQYSGKSWQDFNKTGPDGNIRLPYLSEILDGRAFNPYVNLTYNAQVTYNSAQWGDHLGRIDNIAFDTYPTLSEDSAYRDIVVTLDSLLIVLPDLVVTQDDISLSPEYMVAGDQATARVYVSNLGRADAVGVSVDAYVDKDMLGSGTIDALAAGESKYISIFWEVSHIGTYPIVIRINADQSIQETNYTNNQAFKNITVHPMASGDDFVVGDAKNPNITVLGSLGVGANIRVIENGTLRVDGGELKLVQNFDNQFIISISDNASLILENGAVLTSSHSVRLYLIEGAKLDVTGSSIQNPMNIIAEGSSTLTFDNAVIGSSLACPPYSNATVTAANTTFVQDWTSFGGDAVAHLTGCSAPSLEARQNAAIYVYRWLTVTVWDGSGQSNQPGHVIPGASVTMTYSLGRPSVVGETNQDGKITFQALCSELRAGTQQMNTGGAFVNTTYWHDSHPYEGDDTWSVMLKEYKAPLVRGDIDVELNIGSARPDMVSTLTVSNEEPARGEEIHFTATITNNGVVDAHNVQVQLTDSKTAYRMDKVLDVVPKGEIIELSTTWKAAYPLDERNFTLKVDPLEEISELDETNNHAYKLVTVRGIADLEVRESGITFDPTSPAMEQDVTIAVEVWNKGDVPAENVAVHIYVKHSAPGSAEAPVGVQNIIAVGNGASETIHFTWTPDVAGTYTMRIVVDENQMIEDIEPGNNEVKLSQYVRDLPDLRVSNILIKPLSPVYVNQEITVTATVMNQGETAAQDVVVDFYLDKVSTETRFQQVIIASIPSEYSRSASGSTIVVLDAGLEIEDRKIIVVVNPEHAINETDYENNEGSKFISIKENRPDMELPGDKINITMGGSPVHSASVGEKIDITVKVKNSGYGLVHQGLINFYAVDGADRAILIGSVKEDIMDGQTVDASISWRVNVTMGNYTIHIKANADRSIEEINLDNNDASIQFEVNAPTPVITIDSFPDMQYRPGQTIIVTGKVSNQKTNGPINNAKVSVHLFENGEEISTSSEVTTDRYGMFIASLYIKQGVEGECHVTVSAIIGDKVQESVAQPLNVKTFSDEGIPWYVYLIILAVVSAAIIGFSAYLYKYGLGRMVECGECGALIPEASKHCPKCGVQFEPGTVKCSECGAWIPSNSASCPDCGTKFITEAIEGDPHMMKMRKQYDSYVDAYREEAMRVMGTDYSEGKFPEWWKRQPTYLSFEQWLSREEERLRSEGSLCPICGTHNPYGFPICQKCGRGLEAPKTILESTPMEKPHRSLRRIIQNIGNKQSSKTKERSKPPADEDDQSELPEEPKA